MSNTPQNIATQAPAVTTTMASSDTAAVTSAQGLAVATATPTQAPAVATTMATSDTAAKAPAQAPAVTTAPSGPKAAFSAYEIEASIMSYSRKKKQVLQRIIESFPGAERLHIISSPVLAERININKTTAKKYISAFVKDALFQAERFHRGKLQGLSCRLNIDACRLAYGIISRSLQVDPEPTLNKLVPSAVDPTVAPAVATAEVSPLKEEEIDKNQSSCAREDDQRAAGVAGEPKIPWQLKQLLKLTDKDFREEYPYLVKNGFLAGSLRAAVDRLHKFGKSVEGVVVSLAHAEFALEHGPLKDKDGKIVDSPGGYIFNAIARKGYFRRPVGYRSPAEDYAEELRAGVELKRQIAVLEAERTKFLEEEEADRKVEAWYQAKPAKERDALLAGKIGPLKQWLKYRFEKAQELNHEELTSI